MGTNPALASLYRNRGKTLLSISGIAFAILLVFMQYGFLGAVGDTATVFYDQMEFDLLVRSTDYLHFTESRTVPRPLLDTFAGHPEIEQLATMSVAIAGWLTPETKHLPQRDLRGIVLIGVDPHQRAFKLDEVNQRLELLTREQTFLIDRATTPEYGPQNGVRFGDLDVERQVVTEVNFQQMQLVGHFHLGTGLAANGSLIVSESEFARLTGTPAQDRVTFGLLKLHDPGGAANLQRQITGELKQRFSNGPPIEVLTREQVAQREHHRWIWNTPIGLIFMMGVSVALIVGATIVYMVLASDIARRMNELATLKAMGYSNRYLAGSVMLQALVLSLAAFVPALVLALGLYDVTYRVSNIPIGMTAQRMAGVLFITVLMCAASGLLAMRKIWQAEPASLF